MRVTTTSIVARIFLFAVAGLFLLPHCLQGNSHKYIEDFTTTTYKDEVNTTAWWDTVAGELRLFPYAPTLAGTYNTPGRAEDVTVSGDYAFVADHASGLQVIDISDPTNPTLLGNYNTPGNASDVTVSGDYAFVVDYPSGLLVIDISDPTNPTLLGTYDTVAASGVTVSGDYAFVTDVDSGLLVIDISDPTNPTLLGTYTLSGAENVTVSGDYAFVADLSSGLRIIDISDPTNPTPLGAYGDRGSIMDVTVSGDYAFLAYGAGLLAIDISDPTNPTFLGGTSDFTYYARGVTISGDYAFLTYDDGLLVFDISDPTNPTLLGSYDTGIALGVTVSGDYAFVANYYSGLLVLDISTPSTPTLLGNYDTSDQARGVAVSGDYAFVANGFSGLRVIDISDLTNPTILGTYDTPGYAEDVMVSGDYAFVAGGLAGLYVIDISDPTNLTLLGTYDTPDYARVVTASGDYAFVTDDTSGFLVIDISDPTNPTLLGNYDTPGTSYAITISGDYAFVTNYTYGLLVIDISDPTNPTLLGTYDTPGLAFGVTISGDYAFVGDHASGLLVINILDPTNPTLLGTYDTPGYATGVTVSGDYAFVADYDFGLLVIDISDPTNPTLLGTYNTPGYARGVTVSGDCAFVADGYSGLQVIRVFQHDVNSDYNVGRSLFVDASNDTIFFARMTTTQTDSVDWELSADGGVNWQDFTPDGNLNEFTVPGIDLVWRSTLTWVVLGDNPVVTELQIEWLAEPAVIDSIWDVPNDQGRQVRIAWTKSGYDYAGSSTPITEYAIYRKIDYSLSALQASLNPPDIISDAISSKYIRPSTLAYPPGDWDFIMIVPARCEETYAAVVPTLADSTITEGMYYTTFFVSAMTETPGGYYDSYTDSGYSVDNIAPGVPTGLMIAYNTGSGTELVWDECPEEDFQYFCIYRSDEEDFEPSPENLEHMTASASWTDPVDEGWQYNYKITAVDCNGNESDAATAATVTGDETPSTPKAFALHQNVPNPFNPATLIRFDLPRAAHVGLHIYDVSGRLVRTLAETEMEPGSKEIAWDGRDNAGRGTASGVYFYRLTAGSFTETRKMVLLK